MRSIIPRWEELELLPHGEFGAALRVDPAIVHDVRAVLEQPGRLRACYVEFPRMTPIGNFVPFRATGIETALEAGESPDRYRIVLRLRETRFREVFSALVHDVLDHSMNAVDAPSMLRALSVRLLRWQRLLEAHGAEGLSLEKQRGLWAELLFLNDIAVPRIGADAAVAGWKGPEGGHQDFLFSNVAVEVKATLSSPHQKMQISGVLQLTPPGTHQLLVFHVSATSGAGGGSSLPQLVRTVRALLDGKALEVFEDKLQRAGFFDVHEPLYEATEYGLREAAFFGVSDGFPRIVESDLRVGVGDVAYSVMLAACEPFRLTTEQSFAVLRNP